MLPTINLAILPKAENKRKDALDAIIQKLNVKVPVTKKDGSA